MVQKLSMILPADNSGALLLKVFQTYQRNPARIPNFLKTSVRSSKLFGKLRKKKKTRAFFIRSVFKKKLPDSSTFFFKKNYCLTIKKRLQTRGKSILGPTTYTIKKKKFLKSFIKVI